MPHSLPLDMFEKSNTPTTKVAQNSLRALYNERKDPLETKREMIKVILVKNSIHLLWFQNNFHPQVTDNEQTEKDHPGGTLNRKSRMNCENLFKF